MGVVFSADKPRSHFQVPGLERAEIPFHQGQVFVPVMDRLRVGGRRFEIRLDHIATVQLRGGLQRRSVEGQDQPLLADAQCEPVLHLETRQPGGQLSVLGGDFGARVLIEVGVGFLEGGFQRLVFLLPSLLDFGLPDRVAAQDKTPSVFTEHLVNFLLEQLQLEHLLRQKLLDLRLGEGGDEMKLRLLRSRFLVGANHAPVAHQGDARTAQKGVGPGKQECWLDDRVVAAWGGHLKGLGP